MQTILAFGTYSLFLLDFSVRSVLMRLIDSYKRCFLGFSCDLNFFFIVCFTHCDLWVHGFEWGWGLLVLQNVVQGLTGLAYVVVVEFSDSQPAGDEFVWISFRKEEIHWFHELVNCYENMGFGLTEVTKVACSLVKVSVTKASMFFEHICCLLALTSWFSW